MVGHGMVRWILVAHPQKGALGDPMSRRCPMKGGEAQNTGYHDKLRVGDET